MTTKRCFKCLCLKDLDADFYAHPSTADGHFNKCKACTKSDVAKRAKAHPDIIKVSERKRQLTLHRREQKKEYERLARLADPNRARDYQRSVRLRDPEKYKARTALGNALRDGKIIRGPCALCGSRDKVQGHHTDYSKPLDVVWECQSCHLKQHGGVPSACL